MENYLKRFLCIGYMIDFVTNKELLNLNKEFGFKKFYEVKIHKVERSEDFKNLKDEIKVVEPNENTIRRCFETHGIDIILGIEKIEEKDSLHQRNSGLNQVLCNLAKKNNISIGISFNDILYSANRGELLGRIMQNMVLCKKYKVNVVFASFAKEKYDLRLRNDLEAFAKVIGIDKFENAKVFKLKDFTDIKVI